MRVFVAGATGAIGRPLVARLLAAGPEVTGMTRSPERAKALRAAGGTAVVADDDPAPLREWLPATAAAIGAPKPLRAPAFLARVAAGRYAVAFSTVQRGVANARAKATLGWEPAHPTWRGTLGT